MSRFTSGIWFNRYINRYQGRVHYKGKEIYIGSFLKLSEAKLAKADIMEILEGERKCSSTSDQS